MCVVDEQGFQLPDQNYLGQIDRPFAHENQPLVRIEMRGGTACTQDLFQQRC